MQTPALHETARDLVAHGAETTQLNKFQREELTAAAIQDVGSDAIESALLDPALTSKLIEALQETKIADRNVLLKEVGEMLVKAAKAYCDELVNDALDTALIELTAESGEVNEDAYEVKLMIDADNAQRARDLNSENGRYRNVR